MAGTRKSQVIFGAVFFIVTSITIGLTREAAGLALVWFGSAIGASWFLSVARRDRWRIAVVLVLLSATATTLFGFGPEPAIPLALTNVLEAWLIALLALKVREDRDWFDNVGGLGAFILVGGIVAPAIASLAGATVVATIVGGSWSHHALTWIVAHGVGTVIAFPLVQSLVVSGSDHHKSDRRKLRAAEFVAHQLAIVGVTTVATSQSSFPLLFLPIVPLLFAAFRTGRAGAAVGIVMIGGVLGWIIQLDTSFINRFGMTQREKILFLQFYLATLSSLAIPISVALRQHRLLVRELEYRKALKRLIAEHSDDAMLNLDATGTIRYASPAGLAMTGLETLDGLTLEAFFDEIDAPLVRLALLDAAQRPDLKHTFERAVTRGGVVRWLDASMRAVVTAHGSEGFAVTIRDVTARKEAEIAAQRASETDQLTGLPNRRALLPRLEARLLKARAMPFSLAIIDIDHFKSVNDRHGHATGDLALKKVGEIMAGMSRHGLLFTRLGGEEFALLSFDPDLARMKIACEDLRRAIATAPISTSNGRPLKLTVSIGLARIDTPMTTGEALQAADQLLYLAKHRGRDRIVTVDSAPPHIRRVA